MSLDVYCSGFKCSFCGSEKDKLTIWEHTGPLSNWWAIAKGDVHAVVSRILYLCFMGCQHFPEPFTVNGCTNENHWERTDRWQGVKREQPRLRGRVTKPRTREEMAAARALEEMGEDHEQE
jgi:hypothetical protein